MKWRKHDALPAGEIASSVINCDEKKIIAQFEVTDMKDMIVSTCLQKTPPPCSFSQLSIFVLSRACLGKDSGLFYV
jgi:hypothetical protein